MLTKSFGRTAKRFNKKNFNTGSSSKSTRDGNKEKINYQSSGKIQCHEYQGFGHIQAMRILSKKKQNKSYNDSLSDDSESSDSDSDEESNGNVALNVVTQETIVAENVILDDPLSSIRDDIDDEGQVSGNFEESFSNMDNKLNVVVTVKQEFLEKIQELTAERDTLINENKLLTKEIETIIGEYAESDKELNQLKRGLFKC